MGRVVKPMSSLRRAHYNVQNILQTFMLGLVAEIILTFIKGLRHVKPNAINKKLQSGLSPRDRPIVHYIHSSK